MKRILHFLILSLLGLSNAVAQPMMKFSDLADMPTARGAIASASDSNYLYVCNGFSKKEKFTGLLEKYDVATNTWSVLTSSLIPKQFPSSAIIGNELYVFNGDLTDGKLNKKMEVVNLTTGKIDFSADNPQPAHAAGVATWEGKLYVFGGKISQTDSQYSNNLYTFDPSTKKWKKLAKMPDAKEAKGVIVDGKLYVIGGYNGNVSDRITMYDISADKWTKLSKLPVGISANSVVAHGTKVYSLFDFSNQTLIGCYDIPSNKFTVLQQNNMIGRRHAGAHILNDKLYIVGGNISHALNSCISSLQVADLKE